MRIISGKLKGQVLVNFKADHLRPTTDRVKETIFNKLISYIQEATVLDLFAGTGNLGIEAYSRGASQVTSVEMNSASIKIIKENYKKLKIVGQIDLIQSDVLKYLKNYNENEGFDIVLIDPPFTRKMAHEVMQAISISKVLKNGSIILIESSSNEPIENAYENISLLDKKNYGDKHLSIFEFEKEAK